MITIKETNVTIMVRDMDNAVNFYQQIGLELKNRWGNHYAQLTAPGVIIGLHPANTEVAPSTAISIGFITDNLVEVKTLLDKMGVEHKSSEDKAGAFVTFADPDGTTLYFMQPTPEVKWY